MTDDLHPKGQHLTLQFHHQELLQHVYEVCINPKHIHFTQTMKSCDLF